MTAAVLRKELHSIIDVIPEHSLPAVKPLLTYLADDYWKPVTEPASKKEIAMIKKEQKNFLKISYLLIKGIV